MSVLQLEGHLATDLLLINETANQLEKTFTYSQVNDNIAGVELCLKNVFLLGKMWKINFKYFLKEGY